MTNGLGALRGKKDIRDYKIVSGVTNLPEEFELPYNPPVKNQGSVNSCVAHVGAVIHEYFEKQQCDKVVCMSTGYLYGTRYDFKGEGMYLRDCLKTMKEQGDCIVNDFPYNEEVPEVIDKLQDAGITLDRTAHFAISRYFKCNSLEDIKAAIYEYGPVMMSIPWYSGNVVKKRILEKSGTKSGNHAIYIYGWNKDGLKFQNSWGSFWGNFGRAILPYDYKFNEAYGITDDNKQPHGTYIKEPKRNWLLDLIYKIINAIVNIFVKHD